MTIEKYVGMDVHLASTSICVLDSEGRIVFEGIVRTRADAIQDFIRGLSGSVTVTFEEGTQAQWLYELIKPLVTEVVVCDPRKNKLLGAGNKGDRIDARKLAELLRGGQLKAVYHNSRETKTLKQLEHNYSSIVGDCRRVMNRIKSLYRSQAIPCPGPDVYNRRNRDQWLGRLREPGLRTRAQFLFDELDSLRILRRTSKNVMLKEARSFEAFKILMTVPTLGAVRSAVIIAAVGSPHRFRTRRQFWTYCGLSVVTRTSDDYRFTEHGPIKRSRPPATRGLNRNFNRRLKHVFKSAAADGLKREPFKSFLRAREEAGIRREMARLTLARKIANITLTLWKNGDEFDEDRMKENEFLKSVKS